MFFSPLRGAYSPVRESEDIAYKQGKPRRWTFLGFIVLFLLLLLLVSSYFLFGKSPSSEHNNNVEEEEFFSYFDEFLDTQAENSSVNLDPSPNLCNENLNLHHGGKSSIDYKIAAAICGWGYNFRNHTARKWRIALFGKYDMRFLKLLGLVHHCPLNPLCSVTQTTSHNILHDESYDVVLVNQNDAENVMNFPTDASQITKKKIYKVLYWREANLKYVPREVQERFDFEMGIHYNVEGILNPVFLRGPFDLLRLNTPPFPKLTFLPPEKRDRFGISIISDCNAGSQRDQYLNQLAHYLGTNRVHRFGRCSGKNLAGNLVSNQAKLISKYKFYFAFENTIQNGYVTEKLFYTLNMPIIPVYYGWIQVPNVTKTPSFIRVTDFASPKSLSEYLLYLDENNAEYMKYHEWRFKSIAFENGYLDKLSRYVAGPDEEMIYERLTPRPAYPNRVAQFCRLCNPEEVERLSNVNILAGSKRVLINPPMEKEEIYRRFFQTT